MSDTYELPLFPLHTVLFPGMALPLHIFEFRYRKLINECIENATPFGVVLIDNGEETGGEVTVQNVGTTAFVTGVRRLETGEMDIATVGMTRFIVESTHDRNPYLTGIVRNFPLEGLEEDQNKDLSKQISELLIRYLHIIGTLHEIEFNLEDLPTDPEKIAMMTAIVLQIPNKDKQRMLNTIKLQELLQMQRLILNREAQILKSQIEFSQRHDEDSTAFSLN